MQPVIMATGTPVVKETHPFFGVVALTIRLRRPVPVDLI